MDFMDDLLIWIRKEVNFFSSNGESEDLYLKVISEISKKLRSLSNKEKLIIWFRIVIISVLKKESQISKEFNLSSSNSEKPDWIFKFLEHFQDLEKELIIRVDVNGESLKRIGNEKNLNLFEVKLVLEKTRIKMKKVLKGQFRYR